MPNRQDEYDFVGREPSVLRHIAMATAREHEFTPPVFRDATEERMVCKQLERFTNAQELNTGTLRIVSRDEIDEPLEIRKRSLSYFDARHPRARGRRVFFPETRASR